jgi:DeoR family glycerol-3-phosphate regulon repressor
VRLASLSEIDTLFIDAPLPEVLRERCAQWETNVHIV